jgi:hypothetical protein
MTKLFGCEWFSSGLSATEEFLGDQMYHDRICARLVCAPGDEMAREIIREPVRSPTEQRFLSTVLRLGDLMPKRGGSSAQMGPVQVIQERSNVRAKRSVD